MNHSFSTRSPKPARGVIGSPEQVFAKIAHLRGAVFLDSATATDDSDAISILTFAPDSILRGNIAEPSELICWLEENEVRKAADVGYPLGGAFGQIDYDGEFRFGLYPHCLIYQHRSGTWYDVGGLSEKLALVRPLRESAKSVDLDFQSGMSASGYCDRVRRAKDYIAAGDIYQVNISQQFTAAWPDHGNSYHFYQELRQASPAPYAAYVNFGDRQTLSSSPELFLELSGQLIRTRPIKGTRPRYRDRERDERSRYDLITSEKERAELIMITDLERNDLGQVSEFGSVETVKLLELETYEHVFHLVSTVEGRLRNGVSHVDALRACFPGGSITGAPKKRSREIIDELEPVPRGTFTGAIGYLGLNGESQFNIAIRTAVVEGDRAHFHVGAGIVADSDPELEHEETLHKAAGILQAATKLRSRFAD